MSRKRMMPCIKTYNFPIPRYLFSELTLGGHVEYFVIGGATILRLCDCRPRAIWWVSLCFVFLGLGVGEGGYKFINSPRTLSLKRILDPEKFHLIKTQDFVINEKYLFFICLIFPNGLFSFSAFRLNTFIQLSWISLSTYYYFDCGSCEIYTRST